MREGREVAFATKRCISCDNNPAFRCCTKAFTDLSAACCRKVLTFVKEKFTTRKICILGLLTALTVILGLFATFRIGNLIKIPFKFITVFVVGFIYGPVSAGIVAAIADFLEALRLGVNPFITAVEFLGGVIFGLCFYKASENRTYYLRAVICALLQFVLGFTVMSVILTKMGIYQSFWAAVWMRLPAMIILFALHLTVMCGGRRLVFRLKSFISKER